MSASEVAILWPAGPRKGTIEVVHGQFADLTTTSGEGTVKDAAFAITGGGPARLTVSVTEALTGPGAGATRVSVRTDQHPFTFLLRDVTVANPVWVPGCQAVVTVAADPRTYQEVVATVRQPGRLTVLEQLAAEPEENFAHAAAATRHQHGPIWLGLSRDMRIFELGYEPTQGYWGYLKPRFHGYDVTLPELDDKAAHYPFVIGRGAACAYTITRRLEDGYLPILHSRVVDGDVHYELTAFVSLERSRLTRKKLRGTHFLVADGHGAGHMFTPPQQAEYDRLAPAERQRAEETVLALRVVAANTGRVARYAWFRNPLPGGRPQWDADHGYGVFPSSGRVYCVSRLNDGPLPQNELAVLLPPGGRASFTFLVPHQPVSPENAAGLAAWDFAARLAECRRFWRRKLASGGRLELPEPVVDEMVKAGLLHLDLVAYGLEPRGSIAATIGVYNPIGSESSPIIQFFDSLGWHDVAERALGYFLEKQHPDGFIQNFGNYMLETGPALFTMGEHYRYTRDDAWVARIKSQLLLSCEFMLDWRRRNMKDELRGRGYGMQEGKVGDPEDPDRYFMLNGYAYLGMKRVAEMLEHVDPAAAQRWGREADAFRKDIRASLMACLARSPVVPLADGSWVPSAPPWAEAVGPVSLFVEPGQWWTHGAFPCRDSVVGPQWLIYQEVLGPREPAADWLLNALTELFGVRNVMHSQPFYARHDYAHLRRGEVAAFLKTWYNGFASLADRETYSWWEHFFHASPHKTHEEAWFLMQTRWMLWLEEGDRLWLLAGVPRAWLADGQTIRLRQVASYFGPLSLKVTSKVGRGAIVARVKCTGRRRPDRVLVRLPHPERRLALAVEGGDYDPATETVTVREFPGETEVVLRF